MVIWFIGISGSGKSTLGKFFYSNFKKKYKNTIFFDGDEFRKIFDNDLKYSLEDRNKNAKRLTSIVKYLSDQNINVIVSANLTSQKYRIWCRKNIKNYFEIFINTPFSILLRRDYKNLYRDALKKKIKNVVGVDLKFVKPQNSDLEISNSSTKKKLYNNYSTIIKKLKSKKIRIF